MNAIEAPPLALREPSKLMRLSRLGSFHQSRLSFMRILLRELAKGDWQFERNAFEINAQGEGYAVYFAKGRGRIYALVAFAHDLPDELRSDRVIAQRWDATFTLFDGVPSDEDIKRLSQNVPYQEAGRVSEKELSLSRANRSERLWDYTIDCLAKGEQPARDILENIGYFMRTTAVYGSGKFGAADRSALENRREFQAPFQVEMLSVYLTRWFVLDLLNYLAQVKGKEKAVALAPELAKIMGIGNSTGLGMAPFIINHPKLFNNWIKAREEAIYLVRSVSHINPEKKRIFDKIFKASEKQIAKWQSDSALQAQKIQQLQADIHSLNAYMQNFDWEQNTPWNALFLWCEAHLSEEGQEYFASLILEPYAELVDPLETKLAEANEWARIDGTISVEAFQIRAQRHYAWVKDIDWQNAQSHARIWYTSIEKLEPRLGERFEEHIDEYEQALQPARDMAQLFAKIDTIDKTQSLADFLYENPKFRHIVRRAFALFDAPYAEIYDNTIDASVLPIDMLRVKLSYFGAVHFDPKSDRWLRISMFKNAPYPSALTKDNADFWPYALGVNGDG